MEEEEEEKEKSPDADRPADTSDQPTDEPSPHRPLSLKQSLGITGCISILGGQTVLVGVTVSVQAAVCTSMIAAIVLERRRVRRSHAAWFSIMRSLDDGPRQLIQMMLSSRTVQILYEVEFWLILLAALTGLGLQFTSTILTGDLRNGPVVGDINSTQVKSFLSYDNASSVTFVSDLTWEIQHTGRR
ncbi:hypothetical protein F5B21DRAFT_464414 [Xylaria acuta]|nr:hypothetical protein F5B21DRAFT_464414 [Xylaria acuta]